MKRLRKTQAPRRFTEQLQGKRVIYIAYYVLITGRYVQQHITSARWNVGYIRVVGQRLNDRLARLDFAQRNKRFTRLVQGLRNYDRGFCLTLCTNDSSLTLLLCLFPENVSALQRHARMGSAPFLQ